MVPSHVPSNRTHPVVGLTDSECTFVMNPGYFFMPCHLHLCPVVEQHLARVGAHVQRGLEQLELIVPVGVSVQGPRRVCQQHQQAEGNERAAGVVAPFPSLIQRPAEDETKADARNIKNPLRYDSTRMEEQLEGGGSCECALKSHDNLEGEGSNDA